VKDVMNEMRTIENDNAFEFQGPVYYTEPAGLSRAGGRNDFGWNHFGTHDVAPVRSVAGEFNADLTRPIEVRRQEHLFAQGQRVAEKHREDPQYPTRVVVGRIVAATLLFAGIMICAVACAYYVLSIYGVLV